MAGYCAVILNTAHKWINASSRESLVKLQVCRMMSVGLIQLCLSKFNVHIGDCVW